MAGRGRRRRTAELLSHGPDRSPGPAAPAQVDHFQRDHVCTELTITGTNTGPTELGDFGHALFVADVNRLEPSGRSIELPAIFVHEVRAQRISAERQYWGLLEYLVQIGAVGAAQPTAPE
jgi:hypothetical protein